MTQFFKSPQNGIVWAPDLTTPFGRVVWVHLVTKQVGGEFNGKKADDYYDATILIKKDEKCKPFLAELEALKTEMNTEFNKTSKVKVMVEEFIQDGDTKDIEKYPFYEGHWVLYAKNAKDIKIIDKDTKEIDASTVTGGAKVRFQIQPHLGSYGFRFKLKAVQFLSDDGTRIGGGSHDVAGMMKKVTDDEIDETETVSDIAIPDGMKKPKGKAAAFQMA